MEPEEEIVRLRRQLTHLRLELSHIDEPLAVELLKIVMADIEARIAAVESVRRKQASRSDLP